MNAFTVKTSIDSGQKMVIMNPSKKPAKNWSKEPQWENDYVLFLRFFLLVSL